MRRASRPQGGVLAAWLPGFRLERCGWTDEAAVVLMAPERGADRVQACTLTASERGVRRGMSLAAARAVAPVLRVERLDVEGERTDLDALCASLGRFSPLVRAEPPDSLLVDADPGILDSLRRTLEGRGHAARLVHAPDAWSARTLARHARKDMVVQRGRLAAALAPLPLAALALPGAVEEALLAAGLRTVGAFAALPGASLSARHGRGILEIHARARGLSSVEDVQPLLAPRAEEPLRAHVDLEDPVPHLEGVLEVLRGLVDDLVARLRRHGQAAVQVEVRLEVDVASVLPSAAGAHRVHIPVRLGRPLQDAARVFRILKVRLEPVRLEGPVTRVELEVREQAPHRHVQGSLLDRVEAAEPLEELCARLQDALGEDAVGGWALRSSWCPEAAAAFVPLACSQVEREAPPSGRVAAPAMADGAHGEDDDDPAAPHAPVACPRPRPSTLLDEPRALRVVLGVPESGLPYPRAVQVERAWLEVVGVDGPERLCGGGARAVGQAPWVRDAWRVQLQDGRRAWISHDASTEEELDGTSGGKDAGAAPWFLRGWFDAEGAEGLVAVTGARGAGTSRGPPTGGRGPVRHVPGRTGYVELVARSWFSFREGASSPEKLAERAMGLGLAGVALTDRDGLYGAVAWHGAARAVGLRALHGALLTVRVAQGFLTSVAVVVQDLVGWSNLCHLVSEAHAHTEKGRGELPFMRLLARTEGLIFLLRGVWSDLEACALRDAAPGRVHRAVARTLAPGEIARIRAEIDRFESLGIPCVATNDVLFDARARLPLQDVLTCIRRGVTLPRAGTRLQPNAERCLKSPADMAALFAPWPDLVARTVTIADSCRFSLDELRYTYPREVVPEGYDALSWLRELVRRGTWRRYGAHPPEGVRRQIAHELEVIGKLDFAAYFLTVHDVVRFAQSRGILCQGRGSAANSAVCYVLGVTSVDPAHQALLFERFLSEERGEPPDIDIDFEHARREEVLQYVYEKYGRHRAAMVNEIIRWRGRLAVRDVGKAVGLDPEQVERLAGTMDHWGTKPPDPARMREAGLDPSDAVLAHVQALCGEIVGAPRHTSIHVGGFVISDGPLIDRAPIEPAAMEGRTVLQWDKDDIDVLGFVKVDLLALGMLTAIRHAFDHVRRAEGVGLDLANVPREDPSVYDLLCEADSTGVFQVESRAQQGMLPRLKPRCFYDLVIETAIVRPGPIQGGMVHPYLRRRTGEEAVDYVDPRLEPILARTLGVPIFQEQVMAMAAAVGGFSPGKADQLRRAMGAWRRKGSLGAIGQELMDGLRANGLPDTYAQQVFQQIQGFAEYGFPESHAASFAHLVYVSAWLRTHHPAAFCAALLDAQPMGFYAPRALVADVERHGVQVLPVDIARSCWMSTLEAVDDGWALRLGFRMVRGFQEEHARRIEEVRGERSFTGMADLVRRTGIGRGALRKLARAGALDGLVRDVEPEVWGGGSTPATPPEPSRTPPLAAHLQDGGTEAPNVVRSGASVAGAGTGASSVATSPETSPSRAQSLAASVDGPSMSSVSAVVRAAPASGARAAPRRRDRRRDAAWQVDGAWEGLFAGLERREVSVLPELSPEEGLQESYATVGLSLEAHPIGLVREELDAEGVVPLARLAWLEHDTAIEVAGLIAHRQRPGTASGVVFLGLEDETGTANVVVWPKLYEAQRSIIRGQPLVRIRGVVQRQGAAVSLLAREVRALSRAPRVHARSRDFR